MRESLSGLAAAVCRAADRRLAARAANPGVGPDPISLTALTAALTADYGDCAGFAASSPSRAASKAASTTSSASESRRRRAKASPGTDRIAGLRDVFGLDERDGLLLLAAAAPDLDADFATAYRLLGAPSGNGRLTVGLAFELLAIPTADADGFTVLGPLAPLRRARLLDVTGEGPWLSRTLRAPDRVSAHLAGDDAPEPLVADMAVPSVPLDGAAADTIAAAIASGSRLVWVCSPLGTAGLAAAAAAFAQLRLDPLVVDVQRRRPGLSLVDAVAVAAREAALTGRGIVVTGAEALAEPDGAGAAAVLWDAVVPAVAVGRQAWQTAWLPQPVMSVDAPTLTPAERAEVWTRLLGSVPDDAGRVELMSLRLTPEEVAATVEQARMMAATLGEKVSVALLRDAARLLAAGTGAGSGRVGPRAASTASAHAGFGDLVLPGHVLAELHRLVAWAAYRDEVLARGPVHGKGGKGTGITALFTGGPGTGKTLAAHVIADELNLELFQVDLSSVIDKYIGETEKNLERIFHQAESRNVVLFFDEADALFGSRSEVRDARDRYANQEVSYLLQRMEHFDGITVLATNLRGNLDQAFSRRMQFVVHFPDPDAPTRHRLWDLHLANAGELDTADPVDVAGLAERVELTGGDIRNIVLAAAYDAVSAGEPLGMRHVREATAREYRKLGRRLPDGAVD